MALQSAPQTIQIEPDVVSLADPATREQLTPAAVEGLVRLSGLLEAVERRDLRAAGRRLGANVVPHEEAGLGGCAVDGPAHPGRAR